MTDSNTAPAFAEKGQPKDDVFKALMACKDDDLSSDGRAFAFTYDAGEELRDVAQQAFTACMGINALDPTVYPSARRLENEVVAASLQHLRAPEGACGTITAGGTESVLLAVKTARDYARKNRPEITAPEMLLPETGHASFHKAAHYYGVKVVAVDCHPETMKASVEDATAKLTPNTILVVGSAASYAHGVIDPITELAALAQQNECLMHVDGCIGAWVLPFQRELGVAQEAFDFTVPGVTSISMDLHKYAYAPKGCSVLLQRRRDLRDAQYYACAKWSGYAIVNSTTLGSKSVAALGAAWSLFRFLGREGYRHLAKQMWEATEQLCQAVESMDDLRVIGKPDMGLVALTTDEGDIFELADKLTEKGWHVQPTYKFGNSPAHIHLTIDPANSAHMGAFIEDLNKCLDGLGARQDPPSAVVMMLEALVATTDQGGEDVPAAALMDQLGIEDGQLPQSSALIHRVINAASPAVREKLLVLFIGELFS